MQSRVAFSSYLFGDQVIWIMFAFAAALWLGSKIVWQGMAPSTGTLLAGGLVFTLFMTDFAVLLGQSIIVGAAILALVVIAVQHLFKTNVQNSVVLVALGWVIGEMLIAAIQGSLNIFNPWV